MSEKINQNIFPEGKKFIDFGALQYFWTKTKGYVDAADARLSGNITLNDNAIKAIQQELESLSGGAGSIATQINNAISALDLPNTYEAKGEAAKAESAAKAYADGLAGNYEVAGAASAAETAAKAYADGLASNYDSAGTAADFNSAMDERVVKLEAIDHNKIATDAAAAAVASVIDGAPEKFDTLKEIAEWISSSESADSAADLVNRVSALEAIDHDAYVDADETVLQNAKDYADNLASNYDAVGAADKALADAKAYADTKVDGKFDAVGSAAQALVDAKADAAALYQPKGDYEAAGTAASAIAALDLPNTYEAKGAADAAQAAAIAQAKLDAAEALKGYYTKTEVDNLLSTNSTGDRAYAKQYTDELFNSFQFAQNSDIDALFA